MTGLSGSTGSPSGEHPVTTTSTVYEINPAALSRDGQRMPGRIPEPLISPLWPAIQNQASVNSPG